MQASKFQEQIGYWQHGLKHRLNGGGGERHRALSKTSPRTNRRGIADVSFKNRMRYYLGSDRDIKLGWSNSPTQQSLSSGLLAEQKMSVLVP